MRSSLPCTLFRPERGRAFPGASGGMRPDGILYYMSHHDSETLFTGIGKWIGVCYNITYKRQNREKYDGNEFLFLF